MNIPAIVGIIIVMGLIFFAGEKLIGIANIKAWIVGEVTVSTPVGECTPKEGLMVMPQIGYWECKQMPLAVIESSVEGGTGTETFLAPGFATHFDWYISPGTNQPNFCYHVTIWTSEGVSNKEVNLVGDTYLAQIPSSGWIKVSKCTLGDYQIEARFNPYTLWSYAPNWGAGRQYYEAGYSCAVPAIYEKVKSECSFIEQIVSGAVCDYDARIATNLNFGETTNFLSGWVMAPTEYNIKHHPTYGDVYCRYSGSGAIYEITAIEMESGCYAIPDLNTMIATVECCPGMQGPTSEGWCSDDFVWHTSGCQPCDTSNPCPGFGQCVVDYTDAYRRTAFKYSCTDGCCVEGERVVSECANDAACPSGYLCQMNHNTCEGHCVGGEIPPPIPPNTCGNGVCEPLEGETPENCPPDCETPWWETLAEFIKNMFTAMLVSGILLFILVVIGRFFVPLRVLTYPIRQPKIFFIVWIVLSIILIMVFAVPVGQIQSVIFP